MKIGLRIRISKKFFVLVSLFTAMLLCSKDVLVFTCKQFPHLYPVINVSRQTFEEIYCYLPLFNNFSFSDLLSPFSIHPSQMSIVITLITESIIFKWFCFSNADAFMFLSHLVFPLCSFWLVFFIYKRYFGGLLFSIIFQCSGICFI